MEDTTLKGKKISYIWQQHDSRWLTLESEHPSSFMSSRRDLVSIEHLLNNVFATGFQAMYKLLLNCMWYTGSRQIHLLRGNQPVCGLLDMGDIRLADERAQMELWQNGNSVLAQDKSGVLLVPWAYCLPGRKYARVVRGKWSFCSKPVSPVALKWFVKLYFEQCSLIPGVNPGVTAWLSFFQSLFNELEQVENVWCLGIACIVWIHSVPPPPPPHPFPNTSGTALLGRKR